MQNNEFEKQVRKKMEELKLNPSVKVWDKVAAALPKEKNRRWLLFLGLFAVISTTTLLLITNGHAPEKIIGANTQKDNVINIDETKKDNSIYLQKNESLTSQNLTTTIPADNKIASPDPANNINTSNKPSINKVNNTAIAVGAQYPLDKKGNNKTDPGKHKADRHYQNARGGETLILKHHDIDRRFSLIIFPRNADEQGNYGIDQDQRNKGRVQPTGLWPFAQN